MPRAGNAQVMKISQSFRVKRYVVSTKGWSVVSGKTLQDKNVKFLRIFSFILCYRKYVIRGMKIT